MIGSLAIVHLLIRQYFFVRYYFIVFNRSTDSPLQKNRRWETKHSVFYYLLCVLFIIFSRCSQDKTQKRFNSRFLPQFKPRIDRKNRRAFDTVALIIVISGLIEAYFIYLKILSVVVIKYSEHEKATGLLTCHFIVYILIFLIFFLFFFIIFLQMD